MQRTEIINISDLTDLVYDNFKTVKLDGGTGLFEAIAIDNLIIDEENGREKFQLEIDKDKLFENNWNELVEYLKINKIDFFPFSFMDEKGIRYILPVLIILELKNELNTLLSNIIDSKSNFWNNNIWNEVLNENHRKTIVEVYKYWNKENLVHLKSYGLSEESALVENKKNEDYKMLEILK